MNSAPLMDARARARAAWNLWVANIAIATGVGSAFLAHVPDSPLDGGGLRLWAYALAALLSTVATLTAVLGVPLVLLARWSPASARGALAQAVAWTLFQGLLFADTRVYNLFQYHVVSAQVWDLLYTRGAQESVHLGWQVYGLIAVGFVVGCTVQLCLWSWLRRPVPLTRWPRLAMPRAEWVFGLVLVPAVLLDKTLYAEAGLSRDKQVLSLAGLFPFYPRVPLEDFSSPLLGVEPAPPTPVLSRLEVEGQDLCYPLSMPALAPGAPKPNVLVLVADCLRRDMFSSTNMPELWARNGEFRRFQNHISGGNATRFGLFSLLYGLHGSYWFQVFNERRSPVLVDCLLAGGYALRVCSSATLNYPELRQTAWVNVPEAVTDSWPATESWRKDELAAEALCAWIGSQPREQPFFGFLFLDSSHQTYSYPPGQEPFQPSAKELNYVALSSLDTSDPEDRAELETVVHRYQNAVVHVDQVLARVLREIDALGLADNTLVLITGDHGEEFLENGFFGHTSNFTAEQVAVPLLLRGPGIESGVEIRPTSHLDVPATLLEACGANPDSRANWTLGQNLLAPLEQRRRVVSGWQELGLWTEQGILCLPLHERGQFDVEVRGYDWSLLAEDHGVLVSQENALAQLGYECSRFLQPLHGSP